MANPAHDEYVLLTTLALRLFCPRCNKPQEARVRWFGNSQLATATLATSPHNCPAPAYDPETDPAATRPLW